MSLSKLNPVSESSSDEDIDLIATWYLLSEKKKVPRKRRYWVHEIIKRMQKYGEYHRLVKELELDGERFFQYFRMTREQFRQLLFLVEEEISKQSTHMRVAISARQRLAITIRYLATGSSYKTLGFSYRIGSSTIGRIIPEVCSVIWEKLVSIYMKLPQDANDWKVIAANYALRWNFNHCIGAIDGKHILITAPNNSGSLYFNYKNTFSIVLLAIADASYRFICVDIGSYGRNCDSSIFSHSKFGKAFKANRVFIPPDEPLAEEPDLGPMPYVLVGDEAFPLMRNLMRPYPGGKKILPENKMIFNYRLSRARRIIENSFGILAARWRVFFTPIMLNPCNVIKVVKAATVLHNYLQSISTPAQIASIVAEAEGERETESALQNMKRFGTRATTEAEEIRNKFAQHFTNKGSVPWQMEKIRRGRFNSTP